MDYPTNSSLPANSFAKRTKIEALLDSPAPVRAELSPDRPDSPLASFAMAASAVLEEEAPRVPTPKSPVEAIGAVLLAEFSGKVEQQQQQQQQQQQAQLQTPVQQPQLHQLSQQNLLPRPLSPSQLSTTPSIVPAHVQPAPVSTASPIPPLTFARPTPSSLIQLQAQMAAAHFHAQTTNKARLSGPIRAAVNIRHGVWAPRLRCRKRKNLHAKSTILIQPTWNVEQLISAVKAVLPDDFVWNPVDSHLRYQAVNDQSLQSLKPITTEFLPTSQSLYTAFDVVRNRRSDGDNFILQLYVYGAWMALLKHPHSTITQLKNYIPSAAPVPSYSEAQTPAMQMAKPAQLECVTLEMKENGSFVRAEFSKRSFLAALQACQRPSEEVPEFEEDNDDDDDDDNDDDEEY